MKLEEALFLADTPEALNHQDLPLALAVLAAEVRRLRTGLQMIVDETMTPEAFEENWDRYTEDQQLHLSALLIAECALEGTVELQQAKPPARKKRGKRQ